MASFLRSALVPANRAVPIGLYAALIGAVMILYSPAASGFPGKDNADTPKANKSGEGPAVLWRDPVNITQRNLYYGPGGKEHEPRGPFTFEQEDMDGSNPKFEVRDQEGTKWTVKMGSEAGPETAASRLVWAVGYFANEDYFVPVLHVGNMQHLHRGANLVSDDGIVHNVRLKRHLQDLRKLGTWAWSDHSLTDTREGYGLRVLMAVINNWDLKDSNNSIYQFHGETSEQRYVVSDLGSSFGAPGLDWHAKGNLKAYSHSKLVAKSSSELVDFNVPAAPKATTFIYVPELVRRLNLRWIGQRIPTPYAVWLGHLLAQLSREQIRDAFRAAGYSAEEVEAYASVLQQRIAELEGLVK